jgi:hypothetical protein
MKFLIKKESLIEVFFYPSEITIFLSKKMSFFSSSIYPIDFFGFIRLEDSSNKF